MKIEQLSLANEENDVVNKVKSCVFTGHRDLMDGFSMQLLRKGIEIAIEEGCTIFYNGMAMGFDLLAAEELLKQKKKHPNLKLISCIPCYGQEKYFTDKDKKRYAKILKKADEKILLSETYYNGCMQVRDKYMAERADMMIAYCKKDTGGTAYTVKLFKKLHPFANIIFL